MVYLYALLFFYFPSYPCWQQQDPPPPSPPPSKNRSINVTIATALPSAASSLTSTGDVVFSLFVFVMKPNLFFLPSQFLIFTLHFLRPAFALTPDGLSLLSLKSAVDTPFVFSDWNEDDATPCRWSGISCVNVSGFPYPRVVGIALYGRNLRGYMPSELGSLLYLRRLNLHTNNFYGSIPIQLFNATSLHSIFLYANNLSGALPASVCNLPKLQNLDLSNNFLSGSLSVDFRKCKQLQRLILARNKFTGAIPKGIYSQMDNLVQLDLSANEFNGSIPQDIGALKSLSGTLNLSHNCFSGEIPKSLGDLAVTVSFDLRNNNLSGQIPATGSFANQGPTAFLNNPLLCGFPLQKTCLNFDRSPPENPNSAAASDGGPRQGLSPGLITLISVADAAGVTLIGLIIAYIYWRKKDNSNGCSCRGKTKLGGNRKTRPCLFHCVNELNNDDSEMEDARRSDETGKGERELVAIDKGFTFELDELLRASAYVLGKSGLGIVYKVVLGNGVAVAVRRLGEGGEQRYKEFAAEAMAIGKVKHPNILRLRAYYWAPDEKLLISDFISNSNLGLALHGKSGEASSNYLSWSSRVQIGKGTARGLAYLHECSPRKYVHGDIKPSNILLDNELGPYISDFGLNRLIDISGNSPSSGGFLGGPLPRYLKSGVQGESTNNYRPPESRVPGSRPNQKWDVYAFGVVMLELVTGKSPEISPSTSSSFELSRWVRKGLEEETPLSDMVDRVLLAQARREREVVAVLQVAVACTEDDPELRPSMKTVSENLDRIAVYE